MFEQLKEEHNIVTTYKMDCGCIRVESINDDPGYNGLKE